MGKNKVIVQMPDMDVWMLQKLRHLETVPEGVLIVGNPFEELINDDVKHNALLETYAIMKEYIEKFGDAPIKDPSSENTKEEINDTNLPF